MLSPVLTRYLFNLCYKPKIRDVNLSFSIVIVGVFHQRFDFFIATE